MSYTYEAKLVRVVDGDTVDLDVDLGFYMTARLRFRILGVDTPELRGGTAESKRKAREAKKFVEDELTAAHDKTLDIVTEKADSFGRWLADIYYTKPDGVPRSLADELILNGHGVIA